MKLFFILKGIIIYCPFYYRRTLSDACPCYLLPMFYLFFYDRLCSGTAERIFTKLSHLVDLRCCLQTYLLDSFLTLYKLHGGPKSDEIWPIFFTTPANFLPSRPNAAEYRNSKNDLLSTHVRSTRVPDLVNFGLQTPENEASQIGAHFANVDCLRRASFRLAFTCPLL